MDSAGDPAGARGALVVGLLRGRRRSAGGDDREAGEARLTAVARPAESARTHTSVPTRAVSI